LGTRVPERFAHAGWNQQKDKPIPMAKKYAYGKQLLKKKIKGGFRLKNTKVFRWNFTGWSVIVFYAVCGLLLLLWPNLALMIANYALAAVLCGVGLVMIIGYIRGEAMDGMMGFGLAKGLIALLVGLVLLMKSELLMTLLPFLWGVSMIAGGFGKFQMAFDMRRIGHSRWWLLLIGSLISFVLGILSVTQPAFVATAFTQFAGISLLAEAALDCASLLFIKREMKHLNVTVGTK